MLTSVFSGQVSFGILYISSKSCLTFSNLKNLTASIHSSLPLCQLFATAEEKCIYKNQTWDSAQKAQKQISTLEQGWQCCIHSFKAGWYSDSICTQPQKEMSRLSGTWQTHPWVRSEIQISQEHHQVVNMIILTLIKRLESLGGKLPPPSMWYFMRKPIPLMPLTAMGIFNIKTRIGITTAKFNNSL